MLLKPLEAYPVCGSLWVEVVDSKVLSLPFVASLSGRCARRWLLAHKQLKEGLAGAPRLHTAFEVFPSGAEPLHPEAWAWHHFIPAEQWPSRLAPGMRDADLGATPGG